MIYLALAAVRAAGAESTNQSVEPEDWSVYTWQTKDGLPQNTVTAIVQTRDGYLWLGTGGGLARFDGVRFRTFGLEDGLGSLRIATLLEDARGILWIGTTGGGVSRWENGRLTRLSESGEFSGADVESLAADNEGTLWIGTRLGLVRWRNGEFARIGASVGLPERIVRALSLDSTGTLWVSVVYEGLFRGTNGHFTHVPQTASTPSDTVASLLEGQDGSMWVGGASGQVWQWHDSIWSLYGKTNGVPVGYLRSLVRGSHPGEVWVGSRNLGLAYFANGSFRHPMLGHDLLEQPISALCVDREGTVWVGAGGGGLSRLSRRRFHYWGTAEGLPDSKVTSVAEDVDGLLWVATETAGPWQFSRGRFTKLADPRVSENFPYYYSALSASDGSIWMAGESLLLRFHKGQDSDWYMIDELWHNGINALCEDGTNVWLGTVNSALFKCDGTPPRGDSPRETALRMMATNGTFGGRIACLAREAAETFWIGSIGGLYRWDKGRVRRWSTQDGLLCTDIQALHRDPDGTLWMGTRGGGLARLKDGRIASITKREGLIDDIIFQILQDDVGHFWLGCNRGIMRLKRKELDDCADGKVAYVHASFLGQEDGMLSEQCTSDHSPSALKAKDGRLLFPTTRGLVEIDPRRWDEPTAAVPEATIDEVLVDGRSQYRSETTALAPGVRRLELRYTAPSLQGAERVRYRYRLLPLDRDWINAGTRRTVSYGKLAPGKYNFQVTACDNTGAWGANAANLGLTVLPHYWETGWFRIGTGLLLIALGGGSVWWWSRHRVARALERERVAHEIGRLRVELAHSSRVSTAGQLASALAHELSQPLGAILRNAETAELLLEEEPPDLAEVRAILTDIHQDDQRATGVIDRLRALLKRRNVERTPLSIEELLYEVRSLVRPDTLERKVHLTMEIAPDLPQVCGDRIQLQQVLLNLLLNGMDAMSQQPPETRQLIVQARKTEERMLELRVRDSGPGIPAASFPRVFEPFFTTKAKGMGLGLPVSKTIIEAHQGRIWAENLPEGGACFCFTLPTATEVASNQ